MRMIERVRQAAQAPSLIDRLVTYFSPARGVRRLQARATLSAAGYGAGGGYYGGRRDRRMLREWRLREQSADADTLPDLPDLRARSSDLRRNTPIATGAIATNVTNVVGEGLQLQANVNTLALGISDEAGDLMDRENEREWDLFCNTADFTRVQHFDDLGSMVYGAILEGGDVFVVRRYRKDDGDVYGTKLQVIEAARVSNPHHAGDTPQLAGGVELNADGVPIAYHVSDRHPGGLARGGLTWSRIAARHQGRQIVLHLYDRMRPDQTRGVPYLAPVIEHLKTLADYSEAEVSAAVVSAFFTVFVKSEHHDPATPPIGERDATTGDNELKLGKGAVLSLAPNESIETANPARPNANFDPFFLAITRQIGVALEIPQELLIKHFTASYSASRAALEMAWQFFRRRRRWLARSLHQVAYEWMMDEAVASGRLNRPGYFSDPVIRQAYLGSHWIGPSRASIDPKKEAEADRIDIELGTKTRDQVCLERTGGDWDSKHRQLAKEERSRRADGMGAAAVAPAPAADDDDESGDGDAENETTGRRGRA